MIEQRAGAIDQRLTTLRRQGQRRDLGVDMPAMQVDGDQGGRLWVKGDHGMPPVAPIRRILSCRRLQSSFDTDEQCPDKTPQKPFAGPLYLRVDNDNVLI